LHVNFVEEIRRSVVKTCQNNCEALRILNSKGIDAAIINLNLADEKSMPIAERLIAAGVPFHFRTACTLPRAMRLHRPDIPIRRKPVIANRLVDALRDLCEQG